MQRQFPQNRQLSLRGDRIKVQSPVRQIITKAHVTEGIVPGVIASSNHCGHWSGGFHASGRDSAQHDCEADCHNKWWSEKEVHPNWVIRNVGDPVGGTVCWMDRFVRVTKV